MNRSFAGNGCKQEFSIGYKHCLKVTHLVDWPFRIVLEDTNRPHCTILCDIDLISEMKSLVAVVVAVVGFALLCFQVHPVNGQVKVAAWNIKNLGMTRLERVWITGVIIKVSVRQHYPI